MARETKNRAEIAQQCRALRRPITSIYVSIYLVVGHDTFLKWIERSKSFPELLRIMAQEHFGEVEDVYSSKRIPSEQKQKRQKLIRKNCKTRTARNYHTFNSNMPAH